MTGGARLLNSQLLFAPDALPLSDLHPFPYCNSHWAFCLVQVHHQSVLQRGYVCKNGEGNSKSTPFWALAVEKSPSDQRAQEVGGCHLQNVH